MSEPTAEPAQEPNAFGTSFEAALAEAFAGSGQKIEPANPTPDIIDAPPKAAEPVAEPKAAEPVAESKATDGPKLPIDDDIELPKAEPEPDLTGMTQTAGERFKQLRSEQKELQSRLATSEQARVLAESRIKELEAGTNIPEDVAKKLSQYETELAVVRLEATEQYQAAVTNPLTQISAILDEVAKKYEIDPDKLIDAVSVTDQRKQDELFEDLLSGMSERDKLKVYGQAERLPAILADRERLYNDRDAALREIEARAEEDKKHKLIELAGNRKSAVALVHDRVLEKIPFLAGEKFGLAELRDKVAAEDFDSADITSRAYNAFTGAAFPRLAKAYAVVLQELETVTDELGKYKKLDPSPKGVGSPQSLTPVDNPNESFADAVNRQLMAVGV